MATLGNILARKGGTPLTGENVWRTFPIPDSKSGRPLIPDGDRLMRLFAARKGWELF